MLAPFAYARNQERHVKPEFAHTLRSIAAEYPGRHHYHRPALCHLPDLQLSAGRLWPRRDCRWFICLPQFFRRTGSAIPWLQSVLAILLTLVVLYVVGRVTSLVVGPAGVWPVRVAAGATAVCGQGVHVGAATAGYHDGEERNEPARGAGGLSRLRARRASAF